MTNILVVDDTVDAAESLAMLFDTLGHETHTAFDGEQALAAVEKYAPHIIFLDLDMPLRDGYEAARSIRRSKCTDHPFIVALTGQSGAEVRQRTNAAGFDFYMQKPANANALLALVSDLAGRQRPPG
jgi:CheY-like chemotaxis protein